MPDYASLSNQITSLKAEMDAAFASSTMTAQDMLYVGKALEAVGNLMGVNDVVGVTAVKIAELETKKVNSLAALETKRVDSLADINADAAASLQSINTAVTSGLNQITGASTTVHPFLLVGV